GERQLTNRSGHSALASLQDRRVGGDRSPAPTVRSQRTARLAVRVYSLGWVDEDLWVGGDRLDGGVTVRPTCRRSTLSASHDDAHYFQKALEDWLVARRLDRGWRASDDARRHGPRPGRDHQGTEVHGRSGHEPGTSTGPLLADAG